MVPASNIDFLRNQENMCFSYLGGDFMGQMVLLSRDKNCPETILFAT